MVGTLDVCRTRQSPKFPHLTCSFAPPPPSPGAAGGRGSGRLRSGPARGSPGSPPEPPEHCTSHTAHCNLHIFTHFTLHTAFCILTITYCTFTHFLYHPTHCIRNITQCTHNTAHDLFVEPELEPSLRPDLCQSPAWDLIYVRARAEPSSEIPLPSEPEPSLARISNLLSSRSQAWLWFWIDFRAQPSLDFLAQACLSFSEFLTLCHM